MGYKRSRPRTYALTPSRKRIGKALARKAPRTVAVQALAGPTTRLHVLSEIGRILRAEMTAMCSDKTASLLRTHSIQDLSHFQWKNVIQELEKSAPVFLHFLRQCTQTRTPRQNRDGVIGVCAAIILKNRFAKMNLLQKIVSLLLYAGHCGKRVSDLHGL